MNEWLDREDVVSFSFFLSFFSAWKNEPTFPVELGGNKKTSVGLKQLMHYMADLKNQPTDNRPN